MDEKKQKINQKLQERYKNDIAYREKKKQIAMQHYYAKKDSLNCSPIKIVKQNVTLFF